MAKLAATPNSKKQKNNLSKRISKAGYTFDINTDIWQLDASIKVNLNQILPDLFVRF